MEEVDNLNLIPGAIYYLERDDDDENSLRRGLSTRGKGEFVDYEENVRNIFTYATFKNIESVNNKPFHFTPDAPNKPNTTSFRVAPGRRAVYKIYKPVSQIIQSRKDEEARVNAFEKMINKQKLPEDKISVSAMFSEEPEVDPTFYGQDIDTDKSSLGTQLKDTYGASLLNKSGGKRHRKTLNYKKSRKSRKSRKSKKSKTTKRSKKSKSRRRR